MTVKIRLAYAALGALALFALTLSAGGETTRARAPDRPVDWPTRTLETNTAGGLHHDGTDRTTTRDTPAARLAQPKKPGSARVRPPRKKTGRTGGAGSRATSPSSPGDMFIDGVPRGSFEAPPAKNDAKRGSHAGDGA